MPTRRASLLSLLATAGSLLAQYGATPLGPGNRVRDINGAGTVVGDSGGLGAPFVSGPHRPHELLPLPAGYGWGIATAINDYGVIVGTVNVTNSSIQKAAVWTPDSTDTYQVQLLSPPSAVNSIARDINERGNIIGTTQGAGLQATSVQFQLGGAPVDLSALGAPLLAERVNNHGLLVGRSGDLFDLETMQPVSLPPLPANWSSFEGYAVNDRGELGGRADVGGLRAPCVWTIAGGWQLLAPLSTFASASDRVWAINSQGDAIGARQTFLGGSELFVRLASGGTLTAPQLGAVPFASSGMAINDAGQFALFGIGTGFVGAALLTPAACGPNGSQQNLGQQGPGPLAATLCGPGLAAGQASLYATTGAPANATGALLISLEGSPSVPAFGGTLVALSGLLGVV
ncbi:MAG: hypothetical protein AB8H80_22575, partial [Planctomycetota bacterium]